GVGSRSTSCEHGAGTLEIASVKERQDLFLDGDQFRPLILRPPQLRTQLEQFICLSAQPCGNFVVEDIGLAKLFQDRMQWRRWYPPVARDLVGQRRLLFLKWPQRFSDPQRGFLLVETDLDRVGTDVAARGDAAVVRMNGAKLKPGSPQAEPRA